MFYLLPSYCQVKKTPGADYNVIEELDVKGWRLEVGKSFELHLMVKTWQDEISKIDQLSQLINIKSILIHLQVFNPKYQIPNTKYSSIR